MVLVDLHHFTLRIDDPLPILKGLIDNEFIVIARSQIGFNPRPAQFFLGNVQNAVGFGQHDLGEFFGRGFWIGAQVFVFIPGADQGIRAVAPD